VSISKLAGFYGFTRMPFGRDLAPGRLHRHAHGEAAARITWAVTEKAIGVITGEVGVGKTVAARTALAGLDPARHITIYVGNPAVGTRGICRAIVAALGQTPRFHTAMLIPQAGGDLEAAEDAERGRVPVLIIDDAHLLDAAQLEGIRVLSNHDMDSASPFAALLIGQPTLRRRLKLGQLAALDQRIAVRYHMTGMTPEETGGYLRHHLALAGRSDTVLSDDAVSLIHQTSRGCPRAVNNLAIQGPARRVRRRQVHRR
jgi:type II secretory pathway predicted ATPase ExeA